MGTLGKATTPFAVLFHRLQDLLSVRILLYLMSPALPVPKANIHKTPSELTLNALVSFLCPVRDFTCRYSASAVGSACASTLQFQWLKFKTRPTLPSVCHLILGHLCGYMSTEIEVNWYYCHLSWKFPVDCFRANWKLLSADLLCSCLVYKVRELAWLKANLLKKLKINTSFWSVTRLSAVAAQKLVPAQRRSRNW